MHLAAPRLVLSAAVVLSSMLAASGINATNLDDADVEELTAAKQKELAALEQKHAALQKEKLLLDLAQALRLLGLRGDPESTTFQQILGFAEEVEAILERARAAPTEEERAAIMQAGLDKRKEWVARLEEAKSLIEAEQETEREEKLVQESPVIIGDAETFKEFQQENATGSENETLEEEMMVRTARLVQKAAREGEVGLIAKFMHSLAQSSPDTLRKVLNWQDRVGATALHWCAFYGASAHVTIAESFLLVPGVDGSILDKENHTACHTACIRGNAAVLSKLIEASAGNGCDPMQATSTGFTCLHHAAMQGNEQVLASLRPLLHEGNVDLYSAGDGEPRTALFMAVEAGSLAAVKLLLEAGASPVRGRRLGEDDEDEEQSADSLARKLAQTYKGIADSLRPRGAGPGAGPRAAPGAGRGAGPAASTPVGAAAPSPWRKKPSQGHAEL